MMLIYVNPRPRILGGDTQDTKPKDLKKKVISGACMSEYELAGN